MWFLYCGFTCVLKERHENWAQEGMREFIMQWRKMDIIFKMIIHALDSNQNSNLFSIKYYNAKRPFQDWWIIIKFNSNEIEVKYKMDNEDFNDAHPSDS